MNKAVKKIYGKLIFLKEALTKINITEEEEKRWEDRHLHEGKDWAVKGYWEVRNHPATEFLVEKIKEYAPFSSVLEIGCNCGPNLYSIAKKFPQVQLKGVDISFIAVEAGNKLLKKEGLSNVELLVGKAYDLSRFSDKSFDIVFTKAVLCHIGPDKIERVIKEMARVAKRAIVLVEYYRESADNNPNDIETRMDYSYRWKRNYKTLLRRFVPWAKIRLARIPQNIWEGDWYIIEALLL